MRLAWFYHAAVDFMDGTLRYLLLLAVLFSLRPPELLVLNEPETSLHPDLLPALGRVIAICARKSQILVVTHAAALIDSLGSQSHCVSVHLEKKLGATELQGIDPFDIPHWSWPAR
jgi:predicted ATPase